MKNLIKKLKNLAEQNGIKYTERINGHIQLQGKLLVNYYPFSNKRTAYIAGTKGKISHITPEKAIEMCNEAPIFRGLKDKRSGNSYAKRQKMFKNGMKKCCWCGCSLTIQTSTIEHVIPLARGGLDNANNRKLACEPCNKERGSNMPELDRLWIIMTNEQREQYKLEIIWLEKEIKKLASQILRKPGKQRQIDTYRKQIRQTEYEIALGV